MKCQNEDCGDEANCWIHKLRVCKRCFYKLRGKE